MHIRVLAALLVSLFPFLLHAQWKVGLNFRATSGYVTDGADEVYVLGETVSTTRKTLNGNEITFQWDMVSTADRSTSYDVRLAGLNFQSNNGTQRTLTITLPAAGTYNIRLSMGDALANQANQWLRVLDNASTLFTIDKHGVAHTGAAYFWDAAGTDRSAAAWPGSNTSVQHAFATTTCKVVIGDTVSSYDSTTLTHFYLEQVVTMIRKRVMFVQ